MIWVVAMVWKDSNKNDTDDGKGKEKGILVTMIINLYIEIDL